MKKLIVIVLLLLVLGGGGWYYFEVYKKPAKDDQKQPVLVAVAPATRADVPQELTAVGNTVPYQTVGVRARLDSQIDEVKFKGGDDVNKGDVLFRLDDRTLKTQIDEAKADLVRDQAQEENLRVQFERSDSLNKKGFEASANLDQARAAYDAQKATVTATAAALENLQVQLQYTEITAPISGRAGTVTISAGNTVKANDTMPLVTINQIKPIWAQISIPQGMLDSVRQAMAKGEVAAIARTEGGGKATGKLDYLDNAVDQTTGTLAARVLFDNTDEALWPGMFVTVTLTLGVEQQALIVPEEAVQHGQDGDFVFAVEDDKAVRKPVKVERVTEGKAVIASGLDGSEKITVDGMMKLDNGVAVKVREPGAKADKEDKKQDDAK